MITFRKLITKKFCNYSREPTTLLGISLTIAVFVGRMLKVLPEDLCITLLTATLPLWVSERKEQIQIGAIEAAILHDIGKDTSDVIEDK